MRRRGFGREGLLKGVQVGVDLGVWGESFGGGEEGQDDLGYGVA